MLKLDNEQFDEAAAAIAEGLAAAVGLTTALARAFAILAQLGDDFDVSPVDPGPDNDVAEGNGWPRESDAALAERAFKLPAAFPRTWH